MSILQYPVGIGLAALGLWVLFGRRQELDNLSTTLDHLRWGWIAPAVAVEAVSILALAAMVRILLRRAGLTPGLGPVLETNMAALTIVDTLPAGSAIAVAYSYRWYRRFGGSEGTSAWVLVATLVSTSISLAVLSAIGLVLAASLGTSLDLVVPVAVILGLTVIAGAVFFFESPLRVLVVAGLRLVRRLRSGRPRGDLDQMAEHIVRRIQVVQLDGADLRWVLGTALANWGFDCACFGFAFLAVGATIPWKGLLLAYGAGQLAANLPITPGGLGAVEGSITIALTEFGGAHVTTVAAVLIYRVIGFWGQIPIGAACGGHLAYGVRRERWAKAVVGRPFRFRWSSLVPPAPSGTDTQPSEVEA